MRTLLKIGGWIAVVLLAILILPALAVAAEAAGDVLPEGTPWWANLVYALVTALVGMFAVPYMARKTQAAKAEAEKLRAEGLKDGIQARHILVSDLKVFLLEFCSTKLERDLPRLLTKVAARKLDADAIKLELKAWGKEAKKEAITYFKTQGLDIVGMVGDAYLDKALRWAADRVSPFPGKETAVKLVEEKYTNWLTEKGVDYVREQWLNGGTPEKPVVVPSGA